MTVINFEHPQIKFLEELFGPKCPLEVHNEKYENYSLAEMGDVKTTAEDVEMVNNYINEAMSDLTPHQKEAIERRIFTSPREKYESIGVALSLGEKHGHAALEYARRTFTKAIQLLRHPIRGHKLYAVYKQIKEDGTYNILELEVEFKKEELRQAISHLETVRNPKRLTADSPIEVLNLSTRTENCLKRSLIQYLDQLIYAMNNCIEIRGLGQKGREEIELKLKEQVKDYIIDLI